MRNKLLLLSKGDSNTTVANLLFIRDLPTMPRTEKLLA
jgi:hypothetical protein